MSSNSDAAYEQYAADTKPKGSIGYNLISPSSIEFQSEVLALAIQRRQDYIKQQCNFHYGNPTLTSHVSRIQLDTINHLLSIQQSLTNALLFDLKKSIQFAQENIYLPGPEAKQFALFLSGMDSKISKFLGVPTLQLDVERFQKSNDDK